MKVEEVRGETKGDFTNNFNEPSKFHKITKNLAYQDALSTTIVRSCRTCEFYFIFLGIENQNTGIMKI